MKKFLKVLICVVFILLISACNANKEYIIETNDKEFKKKIENKETFIVYVGRDGCSHCASYKPVFEKALKDYNLKAYYLDTDKNEIDGFYISGTPTILFINKGEEETTLNRITGETTYDKTVEMLKENGYIK